MKQENWNTALILSGGGARAAYQVGVLKAFAELLPNHEHNPFGIICGTSAGAINATAIATRAAHFGLAVKRLELVWSHFRAEQVYHTGAGNIISNAFRWLAAFIFTRIHSSTPVSLLDNRPLRMLLRRVMRFERIETALQEGDLHALCITASGYTSGQSVSFFEATEELKNWRRPNRIGKRTRIGLEHLLASSAIPAVFPAVRINREFFGDGAVRQLAPISPALHLGARKVCVIGVSSNLNEPVERKPITGYPTHAQIAGHLLNSAFLDGLDSDVQALEKLNAVLQLLNEEDRQQHVPQMRPVDFLLISPSKSLDSFAYRHRKELPWIIRRVLGIRERDDRNRDSSSASLMSYLLFESGYTRDLIQLGYQDAMARKQEILDFLDFPDPANPAN